MKMVVGNNDSSEEYQPMEILPCILKFEPSQIHCSDVITFNPGCAYVNNTAKIHVVGWVKNRYCWLTKIDDTVQKQCWSISYPHVQIEHLFQVNIKIDRKVNTLDCSLPFGKFQSET